MFVTKLTTKCNVKPDWSELYVVVLQYQRRHRIVVVLQYQRRHRQAVVVICYM